MRMKIFLIKILNYSALSVLLFECIWTLIFIYYAFHDCTHFHISYEIGMQEIKDSFHVIFIFILYKIAFILIFQYI